MLKIPEEQRLVAAARGGDRAAFEQLYQAYYPAVYALAYSTVRERNTAEAILRDTFSAACSGLGGLPADEPFGRWVQRIAFVQCDAYLRRTGRPAGLNDRAARELLADADPETFRLPLPYTTEPELQARLERVVSRLPGSQRCALTLYYNNALAVEDAAVVMGVRPETVRSDLALARREIVRSLREAERAEGRELPWGNASETTPYRNAAQVPLLSGMIAGGVAGLILDQVLAASAGSAAGGAAVSSVAGTAAGSTVSGTAAASTVSGAAVSSVAGTAVTSAAATAGVSAATKIVIGVTAAAVVVGGGVGVKKAVDHFTAEPSQAVVASRPDELLIEAKHYSPGSTLLYCIDDYDYDENCLVIGINRTYYNPFDEVEDDSQKEVTGHSKVEFRYDDAGRIVSVTETGDEDVYPGADDAEFEYDADGNLIRAYYANHDTPITLEYTYDSQGKRVHLDASINRTPNSVIGAQTSGSWRCEDNGDEIIMTADDGVSPDFVERYDEAGRMTEGFDFYYYVPVHYNNQDYPGLKTRERSLSYTINREGEPPENYDIKETEYYSADVFGQVTFSYRVNYETVYNGELGPDDNRLEFDDDGHLIYAYWGLADSSSTEFYYAKTDDVLRASPDITAEPEPTPEPADAGWKEAYLQYLEQLAQDPDRQTDWYQYGLAYINDDDIPELVLIGEFFAAGGEVCTYYDGEVHSTRTACLGVAYHERGNLMEDSYMHSGFGVDVIYTIRDGEFVEVAKGEFHTSPDDPSNFDTVFYTWNGTDVSEETYEAEIRNAFDPDEAVFVEEHHDYYEFVSMLSSM